MQVREVGTEALHDVLEIAVGGDADVVDRPAADRRTLEQALDLLLGRVRQLLSVPVEELHAVVLRRIVRGGDDAAEVQREQSHGRRWQHARDDRVPAGRRDSACEHLLELDT